MISSWCSSSRDDAVGVPRSYRWPDEADPNGSKSRILELGMLFRRRSRGGHCGEEKGIEFGALFAPADL